jgi:exodeoxyribonuclease VII small subunit
MREVAIMASKSSKHGDGVAAFESSTRQLEAIIKVLEDESTSLEKSLESFEQGINLTRSIQKSLSEAEQKVQMLLQGEQGPVLKDFEEQE